MREIEMVLFDMDDTFGADVERVSGEYLGV